MGTLWHDLKYGFRTYQKSAGFTLISVVTLALGIGASTAVFSVVDAVLLKPLPYPQPASIVIPWRLAPPGIGYDEYPWGRLECLFYLKEAKSFQDLGAFKSASFNLTGNGEPVRLDGVRASVGFLRALGVNAILGRGFVDDEDQPGHEHVVVLGYRLWQERFGSDTKIVGKAIELNGYSYIVVGVMPASFDFPRASGMPQVFTFPRATQLWVPLALPAGPPLPGEESDLALVGRLKSGVGIREAQGEMAVLTKRLETVYPWGKGWFKSRLVGLGRQITGDSRRPLLLILGAVGVVLLIACSNVASLLLTRSLNRQREFTLRAALGAGRARLIRQLLTESTFLALAGGVVGVALSEAGIYFAKVFGPPNVPDLQKASLNLQVFLFALGVTLATGILFGLAPALGTRKAGLSESMKTGGERSVGEGGIRFRKLLLVCETALAVVLVIGSGLLVRTFLHLLRVNPGFTPDRVLTFELSLPALEYGDQNKIVTFYERTLRQLRSVSGVNAVGIVETLPMGGATESTVLRIPGFPNDPKRRPYANYTIASPGYFAAVGTPVLRGRDFLESDTADSLPVTVINAAMAEKFWPDSDPLGKQVGTPTIKELATVIGVVPDVKHVSLSEEPGPEMYMPYTQKVYPSMLTMDVVLRTKVDAASMTDSVRNAMHSVAPDVPLARIATLKTVVEDSMTQQRFSVILLTTFGIVALLMASIGMYGVISHLVAQRTREIGVRMALGAQRRDVFLLIIGQGARLASLGIAIGLIAALAITHLMRSFLYGVRSTDPLTFAAVAILLITVALLACFVPARRATRIDPMFALRYE